MNFLSNIPLPSGIDAAQRHFREIQSAIDTTGARTLEAATISQGNLRVRHGGNIIIADGGTLNISGGNLKLGKGIIEGSALKEQMEATSISAPTSQDSTSVSSSWKTIRSVSVNIPAWADKALLIVTGSARINYRTDNTPEGTCRLLVNGTAYGEAGMSFSYELADNNPHSLIYTMPITCQLTPGGAQTLRVELQNRSKYPAISVRTAIMGVAIWTRSTQ